jgi:hypothetical protein
MSPFSSISVRVRNCDSAVCTAPADLPAGISEVGMWNDWAGLAFRAHTLIVAARWVTCPSDLPPQRPPSLDEFLNQPWRRPSERKPPRIVPTPW